LEISKIVLTSDHDELIRTHDNLGLVYYAMQQYTKAYEHFQMAKDISEKSLPVTNTLFLQVQSHLHLADERCQT
jgi:tetratricopeptide (TPR) repeat protein